MTSLNKQQAMKSINTSHAKQQTANTQGSFGYLTFWTIHEDEFDPLAVAASASHNQIPMHLQDRLTGKNTMSAWKNATQLGAGGEPSALTPREPKNAIARYLTRIIEDDIRVIIREVILPDDTRVSTVTMGVLTPSTTVMWELTDEGRDHPSREEFEHLITRMQRTMADLVGKLSSNKVRSIILSWLQANHRVCVRGTGGVYFLPKPESLVDQENLVDELVSIRNWVNDAPLSSMFSSVELFPGDLTSAEDYVESAIAEIRDEITDMSNRLRRWRDNSKMNAGSRNYSAGTMVEKAHRIREKIAVLKAALGEGVGVTEIMLEKVMDKATAMVDSSYEEIQQAKLLKKDGQGPGLDQDGKKQGHAKRKKGAL